MQKQDEAGAACECHNRKGKEGGREGRREGGRGGGREGGREEGGRAGKRKHGLLTFHQGIRNLVFVKGRHRLEGSGAEGGKEDQQQVKGSLLFPTLLPPPPSHLPPPSPHL
jgi:hypothetical protein